MSIILDKFSLKGKVAWITGASYGLGLAYVKAKVGSIDILVNNAGIIKRIPMHEMTAAE